MKLYITFGWKKCEHWRLISLELLSEIQGETKPDGLFFIDLMVLKFNFAIYIEREESCKN